MSSIVLGAVSFGGCAFGHGKPAPCGEASVSRLVVQRLVSLPNPIRFSFPARVTLGPDDATAVAAALCALPKAPVGPIACPGDLGLVYRLTAYRGSARLWGVRLEATGCQSAHGGGLDGRWAAQSPHLWNTLARAMHLSPPRLRTLTGTLGGG